MNCKQGDLAIVVKSYAGNEGKIVTCVRFVGDIIYEHSNGQESIEPSWETDTVFSLEETSETSNTIPDSYLRPLKRLDELEDEINKELELVK